VRANYSQQQGSAEKGISIYQVSLSYRTSSIYVPDTSSTGAFASLMPMKLQQLKQRRKRRNSMLRLRK
jgi:hypothetical protein